MYRYMCIFTHSFSDGSTYGMDVQRTVEQALRLVREGAGVLDVGGESTRPGAQAVPAEEEVRRVLPAIRCEERIYASIWCTACWVNLHSTVHGFRCIIFTRHDSACARSL
jgi:hypothetical protein